MKLYWFPIFFGIRISYGGDVKFVILNKNYVTCIYFRNKADTLGSATCRSAKQRCSNETNFPIRRTSHSMKVIIIKKNMINESNRRCTISSKAIKMWMNLLSFRSQETKKNIIMLKETTTAMRIDYKK